MSDELRDLLKAGAADAPARPGDFGDVVRGGRGLKWRRRLYAAGVVAVVVALAWTTIPGLLGSTRDGRDPTRISGTPTPDPDQTSPVTAPCSTVPFRPTYLPDGWSYELQQSESELALGRYTTIEDERLRPYVDIALQGNQHVLVPEAEPLEMMGENGRIGVIHEGFGVEFSYDDCDYSLNAYGPSLRQLRQIAIGLRPTEGCDEGRVMGPDADLGDGRHFVYITAVDIVDHGMGIQFDRAKFLTGAEANEAAVAAGAIEEGESVPNDYFIVNQSERTAALGFADDVEVYIETLQDGLPGTAPADTLWLACAFASNDASDQAHRSSPYWITVRDQSITKIEEQYLP